MNESVITLLSFFTLLTDIGLVILLIIYVLPRSLTVKIRQSVDQLTGKYGLAVIFIISLGGALGSLFLSEIAFLKPCPLCWYQRIFMYPLAILSGVAILKKDKSAVDYLIPLSIIGGLVALYHYSLQIKAALLPAFSTTCSLDGVSCAGAPFFDFGYITIPLMSLSAFLLIIIISLIIKNYKE